MPKKAKETIETNDVTKLEKVVKTKNSKVKTEHISSSLKREGKNIKPSKSINVEKKESLEKTNRTTRKKNTNVKRKVVTSSTPKKIASNIDKISSTEYYDLPYRYNETIVRILAQTPKSLFVYWDISDKDRENLVKSFGENFFNDTIPFLRIKNENNGYYFDVDIDDFANGWYVSTPDAKSTYSVSLLRKQKPFRNKIVEHEIYLTTSNKIESPNDHILFEKTTPTVLYKNVKDNTITAKSLPSAIYKESRKTIYGLYEYYKDIYQNENINDVFNLDNPSSSNPTSTFK